MSPKCKNMKAHYSPQDRAVYFHKCWETESPFSVENQSLTATSRMSVQH